MTPEKLIEMARDRVPVTPCSGNREAVIIGDEQYGYLGALSSQDERKYQWQSSRVHATRSEAELDLRRHLLHLKLRNSRRQRFCD